MLEFEYPPIQDKTRKRAVRYWLVSIQFENVKPMEFRVRSIPELCEITGIKLPTMKKILYAEGYKTKRFDELLKFTTFTPVY